MESDRARVLLIEDEVVLRTTLADLLHRSGLTVRSDCDGTNLLSTVADFRPDLLILDIMLPGESGFTLARRVRERSDTSILFLTARDAVADRLTGFDIGADDYLVKPFVQAELLARVRAVLRRSGRLRSGTLQVADLLVDAQWCGGNSLISRIQVVCAGEGTQIRESLMGVDPIACRQYYPIGKIHYLQQ